MVSIIDYYGIDISFIFSTVRSIINITTTLNQMHEFVFD